jgi:hypothetical protein
MNCLTTTKLRKIVKTEENALSTGTAFNLLLQQKTTEITAQTIDCCKCLHGYLGSIVSPRYLLRDRTEQTGQWTCQETAPSSSGGDAEYDFVWNPYGYKSWTDLYKDEYKPDSPCPQPISSSSDSGIDTESSSSSSEELTCQGFAYDRQLQRFFNGEIPSSEIMSESELIFSYPKGFYCRGDDTYRVLNRFQCERVLIYTGAYHDGCRYYLGEPKVVLRPVGNSTPDAPKTFPYAWRTCPYFGDEDEPETNYLYFKRYTDGANYHDVNLDEQILYCIIKNKPMWSYHDGIYKNFEQMYPAGCKHTLIINANTFYNTVWQYTFPIDCANDQCHFPPVAQRTSVKISDTFADCKAYVWLIQDGCQDYPEYS